MITELLALPRHGSPGAPTRGLTVPSGLWLPVVNVIFYAASEFDERFDRGEDVTSALHLAQIRRPDEEERRENVDFRRLEDSDAGKSESSVRIDT
ncbi:hypothetical protein EV191_1011047 [Tamaricihabitans halophyticus]|uniref:Uncharacterized protein n=1 Tax=Tamaricihabitans halophyticus TaxID=1262583 RepID=A0A4R2RCE0_9PSEU|nr:hypothetical protein [Tamaricihabitans halophyticus]TCP57095.1 hypothetical protein EV191_1011047 [Tamaricihabitans halophyticus]